MTAPDYRQQEELEEQEWKMDLLKINVNDHIEKKNGLSYLSWAWAWAEVLKIDPAAEWEPVEYPQPDGTMSPCMYVGGGTAMVKVRATIKGKTRVCQLPVMDHRNKAIKDPDAFAINTATQRCLAKAIAMHGLGLYIYAGEDLPEGEEGEEKPSEPHRKANGILPGVGVIKATDGAMESLDDEQQLYIKLLGSTIPKMFTTEGVEAVYDRIEREQFDNIQLVALWSLLDSKVRSALKKEKEKRLLAAKHPAIAAGQPAH